MKRMIGIIVATLALQANVFAVSDEQKALIKAFRKGDVEQVVTYIDQGVDLNYEMGLTPLVMAVRNENIALVDKMLKAGADVNFTESQPANALVSAAATGNLELLNRLLSAAPDINARAYSVPYRTALMQAAESGHLNLVQRLVEIGADLTIGDYNDDQVLAFAAYFNHPDIIQFLVEKGADINHVSTQKRTPLDHALRNNSEAATAVLMKFNAHKGDAI